MSAHRFEVASMPGVQFVLSEEYEKLEAENERLRAALRTIRGPEDRGPWILVYREAGGGYQGLQAIAEAALAESEEE